MEYQWDRLGLIWDERGVLQAVTWNGASLSDPAAEKNSFSVCVDGAVYALARDFEFDGMERGADAVILRHHREGLRLRLRYGWDGARLEMRAQVECDGPQRLFEWAEFALPAVRVAGSTVDCFNAPGLGACHELTSRSINFRPDTPVRDMGRFVTEMDMYATSPDKDAGLLCVSAPEDGVALGAFPWSVRENTFAMTRLNGDGIDLIFRNTTCFWSDRHPRMEIGGVYVACADHLNDVLRGYQAFLTEEAGLRALPLPEWAENGAILELHASQIGGFRAGIDRLDALRELGVRTLYLMPCLAYDNRLRQPRHPFGGIRGGSFYAITDYHRIDPLCGTEQDFHDFVDAAHARGMRILFDFVPQGVSNASPLPQQHPEWFVRDAQENLTSSHGWNDTWSTDWANPEVRAYFVELALYYVKHFHIDGFRMDAMHWKEPNLSRKIAAHCSETCFGGVRLEQELSCAVRDVKSDALILNEVWGVCYEGAAQAQCEYNISWMLYNVALGRFTGRDMQKWLARYRYTQLPGARKAVFLETHDTGLLTPVASALRGSRVMRTLFTAAMFMGYLPMIYLPTLDDMGGFYRELLAFRRSRLAELRQAPDLEHVRADSEHVFVALRTYEGRTTLFLAALSSFGARTRVDFSGSAFAPDPEAEYRLVDQLTGEYVYFAHEAEDGKIDVTDRVRGAALSGERIYVPAYGALWLEIVRAN